MMNRLHLVKLILIGLTTILMCHKTFAIPISFDNEANYLWAANALVSDPRPPKKYLLNTANLDIGGQGLPFQSSLTLSSGHQTIRTRGFNTTSGDYYFGANDPDNYNQFSDGDVLSYSYSNPRNPWASKMFGVGMHFISSDLLEKDDISITIPSLNNLIIGNTINHRILADGGFAYYTGLLIDDNLFNFNPNGYFFNQFSISFKDDKAINFFYNIDDISLIRAVPEPSILALYSISLLMAGLFHWRSKRTIAQKFLQIFSFKVRKNQLLSEGFA